MNIVLLADKKYRKSFELAVKKIPDITLLGVEMLIRGNTMSRIADHHNPHALVIYRGVPEKDGLTTKDLIAFLRVKRPNLRIVYVYGEVKDINQFTDTVEMLTSHAIYDIVTDMDFQTVFSTLETPMTEDQIRQYIEELTAEPEKEEILIDKQQSVLQITNELELDFPSVCAKVDFDMESIMTVSQDAEIPNHACIGIAQLQHHNGCTHTAFEIATTLSKKCSTAVVIADEDTFNGFAAFHRIITSAASEGLNVSGIDVYPYSKLTEIRNQYGVVVCDFGFLRDHWKNAYGDCDVKIMLCSAAEWDMPLFQNYVNYSTESYLREIKFLFSRVSQSKFVRYNRQFMRSGIEAYRLHHSPDWTHPDSQNVSLYNAVLSSCSKLPNTPKPKKRLFKVK